MECPGQDGLHVWSDHFYPEVIDPDSLLPVPDGSDGMLVITTLTKRATPFLRYATKDIVSLTHAPCPACGRHVAPHQPHQGPDRRHADHPRHQRFPVPDRDRPHGHRGDLPHYQIIVTREGALDEIEVQVEVNEKVFSDEIRGLEALEKRIRREIESVLSVAVKVKLGSRNHHPVRGKGQAGHRQPEDLTDKEAWHVRQADIRIHGKPRRPLEEITGILAENQINIRALALATRRISASSADRGRADRAAAILRKAEFTVRRTRSSPRRSRTGRAACTIS